MLFTDILNRALEEKAEEFRRFLAEHEAAVQAYLSALAAVEKLPYNEIVHRFENAASTGAIPAAEMGAHKSFSVPFGRIWANHEQARGWAEEILENRTTFAADGSQIYSGKETSLPIAGVQIGWFANPHNFAEPYEKNARFEILTPSDLLKEQDEPMNPDIRVEARRYLGEAERICEFLEGKKGWADRGERMPVAFFDNPLLVPFSLKGLQKAFLDATVRLIDISAATHVPVVGYVDRSFSRDILTMLDFLFPTTHSGDKGIFDSRLLQVRSSTGARTLDIWGDRTVYCYSKRRGLEPFIDELTGRSKVGFVYLQTTADSPPARLDMPAWVFEMGLLDEVVDTVRAECVIGVGYPYVLETADATAVISTRDREVFFRALQEFAMRGKLDFGVTRKDISKARRR